MCHLNLKTSDYETTVWASSIKPIMEFQKNSLLGARGREYQGREKPCQYVIPNDDIHCANLTWAHFLKTPAVMAVET